MIKGVKVASRAVGSALMMLIMLVYIFAIVMFSFLRGEDKWDRLGTSMWTLLIDGVFLDGLGKLSGTLMDKGQYHLVALLMIFVLGANLTVLNMLVGVLCEVVSVVAATEKEDAAIKLMKDTLLVILLSLDEDKSGMISKEEMQYVIEDDDAMDALKSMQVNEKSLLEQLDMLFSSADELSIEDIMNLILMLRGDRSVTVSDMTHGQSITRWKVGELRKDMKSLDRKLDKSLARLTAVDESFKSRFPKSLAERLGGATPIGIAAPVTHHASNWNKMLNT